MVHFISILHGRHYGKDDFRVATSFIEPMGLAFDDALDIVVVPALSLLDIAKGTGKDVYLQAAKKALGLLYENGTA